MTRSGEQLTCRELLDFLMDYLNGELPPEERRVFDEHVAICPSCVNYLRSYEATVRLGRAAFAPSAESMPPEVPPELVRAIREARKKPA